MIEERLLREKWLTVMSFADENYVEEADPTRPAPVRRFGWKKVRRTAAIAACVCVLILGGWVLFAPFPTTPPDVSRYAASEYYPLICRLNEITYVKPEFRNRFQQLAAAMTKSYKMGMEGGSPSNMGAQTDPGMQIYRETTDNQAAGVIEGDIIKRSDRYIYYLESKLDSLILRVYSIDGENTRQVGMYELDIDILMMNREEWEFYLSEDCRTVTVVAQEYYGERIDVAVVSLDVSDPSDIREKTSMRISGHYLTSRVSDGKLLLMTRFGLEGAALDFGDASTFLPQITRDGRTELFPAEDVVVPETPGEACYSCVFLFDCETLETEGQAAFLSCSQNFYVSAEHVFLTQNRVVEATDEIYTQILCLSYRGGALEPIGSVTVQGVLKDQYSMDEYEGLLRVVTTTDIAAPGRISASLFCIDLADFEIVGAVRNFAPGEKVESVRFDGPNAYVCTAERVTVTDPVFFFDLSDPGHITYKDTGTIDGFSTSLVDFGDGKLLGIGCDTDWGSFKAEIYEETETGVRQLCSYVEDGVYYSAYYKSYYIDREHQLLGLGIHREGALYWYMVLCFDGSELRKVVDYPLEGVYWRMRGVYIDGYMYMFCADKFAVEKLSVGNALE